MLFYIIWPLSCPLPGPVHSQPGFPRDVPVVSSRQDRSISPIGRPVRRIDFFGVPYLM